MSKDKGSEIIKKDDGIEINYTSRNLTDNDIPGLLVKIRDLKPKITKINLSRNKITSISSRIILDFAKDCKSLKILVLSENQFEDDFINDFMRMFCPKSNNIARNSMMANQNHHNQQHQYGQYNNGYNSSSSNDDNDIPKLEELYLYKNNFSDAAVSALHAYLFQNYTIRALSIGGHEQITDKSFPILKRILKNSSISSFGIKSTSLSPNNEKILSAYSKVNSVVHAPRVLVLDGLGLSDDDIIELSEVFNRYLGQMRGISVAGNKLSSKGVSRILDVIRHTDVIIKINLSNNKLGDTWVETCNFNKNIVELVLNDVGLTSKSIQSLTQKLSACAKLSKLSLSGNKMVKDITDLDMFISFLEQRESAFELDIDELPFSGHTKRKFKALCKTQVLIANSKKKAAEIKIDEVGDDYLLHALRIATRFGIKPQKVDLSASRITESSLQVLFDYAASAPGISEFDLSTIKMTIKSADKFHALGKNITKLNLTDTNISDTFMEAIFGYLKECTSLSELIIDRNPLVTEKSEFLFKNLFKYIPNLQVSARKTPLDTRLSALRASSAKPSIAIPAVSATPISQRTPSKPEKKVSTATSTNGKTPAVVSAFSSRRDEDNSLSVTHEESLIKVKLESSVLPPTFSQIIPLQPSANTMPSSPPHHPSSLRKYSDDNQDEKSIISMITNLYNLISDAIGETKFLNGDGDLENGKGDLFREFKTQIDEYKTDAKKLDLINDSVMHLKGHLQKEKGKERDYFRNLLIEKGEKIKRIHTQLSKNKGQSSDSDVYNRINQELKSLEGSIERLKSNEMLLKSESNMLNSATSSFTQSWESKFSELFSSYEDNALEARKRLANLTSNSERMFGMLKQKWEPIKNSWKDISRKKIDISPFTNEFLTIERSLAQNVSLKEKRVKIDSLLNDFEDIKKKKSSFEFVRQQQLRAIEASFYIDEQSKSKIEEISKPSLEQFEKALTKFDKDANSVFRQIRDVGGGFFPDLLQDFEAETFSTMSSSSSSSKRLRTD